MRPDPLSCSAGQRDAPPGGVDTHADTHVAAALDPVGGLAGRPERTRPGSRGTPCLYDTSTGELACEWPALPTGDATSSIVGDNSFSGPVRIAVDEPSRRFAVTDGQKITIIALEGDFSR